jgi:hypothetical protein
MGTKTPTTISALFTHIAPKSGTTATQTWTAAFYIDDITKNIHFMIFHGAEATTTISGGVTTATPATTPYTNGGAILVSGAAVQASKITAISYGAKSDEASEVSLAPHPITQPRSWLLIKIRLYYLTVPDSGKCFIKELVLSAKDGTFVGQTWSHGQGSKDLASVPIDPRSPLNAKVNKGTIKVFFRRVSDDALTVAWNNPQDGSGKVWMSREAMKFLPGWRDAARLQLWS